MGVGNAAKQTQEKSYNSKKKLRENNSRSGRDDKRERE